MADTNPTAPEQDKNMEQQTETEASAETQARAEETQEAAAVNPVEQQLQDMMNQYARLQADFENFKRRSRLEREELIQFSTSRLIQSLLPVLDNLDLALVAGKDTQDVASITKGIEMVARQFQTILEQEGLTPLETVGQPFDPNQHEGVMQVEATDEYPSGTVVEELRRGYVLKGKVIRPAMVKVSQ